MRPENGADVAGSNDAARLGVSEPTATATACDADEDATVKSLLEKTAGAQSDSFVGNCSNLSPQVSQAADSQPGHAAGPSWVRALDNFGSKARGEAAAGRLVIEAYSSVRSVRPGALLGSNAVPGAIRPGLELELSGGRRVAADVAVAALGVVPNTEWVSGVLERGSTGGILVNDRLESVSALGRVWAAGDACDLSVLEARPPDESQWFQMRLWTQVWRGRIGGRR